MNFCPTCESLLSVQLAETVQQHCGGCGARFPAEQGSLGSNDAATNWIPPVLSLFRFDPAMPRKLADCEACGAQTSHVVCDPVLMKGVMMSSDRDMAGGVRLVCDKCGNNILE